MSRRGWDDRGDQYDRKRKSEDDYSGHHDRRVEGRTSRQHRDHENKRYRNDDDNDRRHDDGRNNRDRSEERYDRHRGNNRGRSEERDSRPQRRNFRDKRNRFEQPFVKKEASPEWGKQNVKTESKPEPKEKEKPNFKASGKLTEDTNTVHGIVIKYSEPLDARKPKRRWRLYPFKGEKALPVLYIHRQSAYLMGRERKIADIPLDHPSCSKQHAALQYRLVPFKRENGSQGKQIRPYIIDLESANGTYVNNVKLEPRRYHELLERDVVKFGFSSREYVVLHEHSKDDELDDDVYEDEPK